MCSSILESVICVKLIIIAKCKQDIEVLTYSSSTKMHGYGVYCLASSVLTDIGIGRIQLMIEFCIQLASVRNYFPDNSLKPLTSR